MGDIIRTWLIAPQYQQDSSVQLFSSNALQTSITRMYLSQDVVPTLQRQHQEAISELQTIAESAAAAKQPSLAPRHPTQSAADAG